MIYLVLKRFHFRFMQMDLKKISCYLWHSFRTKGVVFYCKTFIYDDIKIWEEKGNIIFPVTRNSQAE